MQIQVRMLLLVEDFSLHDLLMKSSIKDSCEVFSIEKIKDVSTSITANNINVVVIDIDRNKEEKVSLLRNLKKSDRLMNVVITGQPLGANDIMEFINHGALGYLEKPVKLEEIEKILEKIVKKSKLRRETYQMEMQLEKKYCFEGMVGKSPHMFELFSLLETIAPYFSTVLITGETGTGKELVAKAIHNLSSFNNRDLVICDIASIPENLVESELFGYVRGAFTGADRDKQGLFEEANNGIIFLDEIGEIPLTTQAKLLRVLESGQFRPLGSNQNIQVNIRVIAATNRNLKEYVKNGKFRQDLYHRLNRVGIHLPPLREKPEDISLLIRHLLNILSNKMNKTLPSGKRDETINRAVSVSRDIRSLVKSSGASSKEDLAALFLKQNILCPLSVDNHCLLADFRPISCRVYGLDKDLRNDEKIETMLTTISRSVFLALAGIFPGDNPFLVSCADTVSGRFAQVYFHYLMSLTSKS